jgi:long-chain acyl-CoA synthetase
MSDWTIHRMFRESVHRFGSRPALGFQEGGEYRSLTYREVWEKVQALRKGLTVLGIKRGDRAAILSENRYEWAISDLAVQSLGVVTVPIYPTLPVPQVEFLVRDSEARVLFVSDPKQLKKAQELRPHVKTLEHIVLMSGSAPEDALTFEMVMKRGMESDVSDETLEEQEAAVSPDDIATLIYTSGTTGEPKGAMLTHTALLHTGFAARQIVELNENDLFLSFLPLSHIIERVGGHYLPLSIGAQIVYSEGVMSIGKELPTVRPTVFLCVPRLFEHIQERVQDEIARAPEKRRRIAQWALQVGDQVAQFQREGRRVSPTLAIKRMIADKLVLRQIREKVSGGRLRFFVAGGAPLNPETAKFFESIGLLILEGYGLTECPVTNLNRPDRRQIGTVGPTLPGMEIKIAQDGEILARGPSLMRGYFGKPEATQAAIDAEGWLHTGDIGEITPKGMLKITDRKKDIIVLANGKNVAPQPIEALIKQSPYIAEAVLIGDKQNVITAIIVPAFDRLKSWAQSHALPISDMAELVRKAEIRKLIKEEIDRLSVDLADFERIKRFEIVSQPFTIEGGELTPTLKVKRKVIVQKYAALIEQMAR